MTAAAASSACATAPTAATTCSTASAPSPPSPTTRAPPSNTYDYSPYGETAETTAAGSLDNPWRYTGQYQDAATDLYKMGIRYYQPDAARWTQPDPALQAYETYLGNNLPLCQRRAGYLH